MVLRTNMELLKASFPELWQKFSELETTLDKELVKAVTNKEGHTTLQVEKNYIHDKKNPLQEGIAFIKQFENINNHSDILFYGIGLGYHIKAFLERYPNKPFSIYEPIPEVFHHFLCHIDLKQFPLHLVKYFYLENKPDDPDMFFSNLVKRIRSSILIIDLPAYRSIFTQKRQAFFSSFENHLRERRDSLAAYSTFQKRWTINSIKNFIEVLNSPNILLEKKDFFKNKPALLVASGPSLEAEIENLKKVRDNGLAYIFTVGTALNALVKCGIYPHAACTYDPSDENQIVCKEVLEKGLKSIPLIFGSTVGYETLEKYPGPKMHMLINQDTLAAFYLKPQRDERLEFVSDAASIAVITLQLLHKLGFNPIILVGQNLAYLDGKNYMSGSTYPLHEANQTELKSAVLVKDVYGNEVSSSNSYLRMRLQIENYLSCFQDTNVINTTKNGAHIEGTRFQTLDEVMKDYLPNRIVEDDWRIPLNCSYDLEYLITQNQIMKNACANVAQLLDKCKLDLDNIATLASSGDLINIEQSYDKFNLSMENLRTNQFFATFITPMSRVELELLLLAIPEISRDRDPNRKAQMMEKEFHPYLTVCEQDINTIIPLFQELNNTIQEYKKVYIVRKKAARTKILLLDCDGILTDGTIYYSASGEELKKFSYKDRAGIILLRKKGIQALLINQEANPVIKHAAFKSGIDTISSGEKKGIVTTVLEKYALDYTEVACIINDLSDLKLLKQVGLSFAVSNSSPELQQEVDYVLAANGGQGAIYEIAELLTKDKYY
ncbi:MAG: 6-hydroxymethylpterin diphosphokinase MptE-like protein [Desulfosporosinus sp.]